LASKKDGKAWWRSIPDDHPASIAQHIIGLDEEVVRTWDRYGGTNLGTSRTNPFNPKKDRSEKVIENISRLGIDVVVAIGGEDTLGVAYKLYRQGVKPIGIPKTIDGDLVGTEYSLGFDSAVNIIMEEIDRLRTTAGSHNRIFVVATMGRHAGWLALHGGECSGAYIILIPEYPFSIDKICDLLQERRGREVQYRIIVVSRAQNSAESRNSSRTRRWTNSATVPWAGLPPMFPTRSRRGPDSSPVMSTSATSSGGSPSARDRLMARWFGIAAIDMIINEDYGRMVSYLHGEITSVPMKEVIDRLRIVEVDKYYDVERYNGKRTIL
jgi:6-phosphofructokinase 1